jgi:UPF0755 protein
MTGRSSGSRVFIFLLVFLMCLSLLGFSWALYQIQGSAENSFGQASPSLTEVQKLTLSFRLLAQSTDILEPANPQGRVQAFKIEFGEQPFSVASRLQSAGLIRDAKIFLLYLTYSGIDTTMQAGNYNLSPAQNTIQIAQSFQDSTSNEVDFGILPGWRLEEIAASLPTSGLQITSEQFMEYAQKGDLYGIPSEWAVTSSVEGFLFPDTYRVSRKIGMRDLITTFIQHFREQMSPELIEAFQAQNLSVYQAVILASMVQREAIVNEEQPTIASVFINRLNEGMTLSSDPTVQFALGFNDQQKTWWTNPLSAEDLKINSPYNTYINAGLPPAPICNPGISAIQAVAHPSQTPFFYFRARCDGSGKHNFAVTLEEQINNQCSP